MSPAHVSCLITVHRTLTGRAHCHDWERDGIAAHDSAGYRPAASKHVRSMVMVMGALLLALAEAAAGVPFAGVFVRDSVGGFAANIVEPDPILA